MDDSLELEELGPPHPFLARPRGIAFTVLLAVTAITGSVFLLLPAAAVLLPFKAIGSYRDCARGVRWWWFSFAAACVEVLGGSERAAARFE